MNPDGEPGRHWLAHWTEHGVCEQTLQALNSADITACRFWKTCNHSMLEFVQGYLPYDLVANDRHISQPVRHWIVDEVQECDGRQSNATHSKALKSNET